MGCFKFPASEKAQAGKALSKIILSENLAGTENFFLYVTQLILNRDLIFFYFSFSQSSERFLLLAFQLLCRVGKLFFVNRPSSFNVRKESAGDRMQRRIIIR